MKSAQISVSLRPGSIDASISAAAVTTRSIALNTLPLSWPGVVTSMVLSFAHTLGEFGVVLMVGGNIKGRTQTVSIAIYDEVQALNYDAAGATAALLVAISFAVLAATYGLQRRIWAVWPLR